ncbi:MAG: ATP-binding protein [Bacteroidetes bacterium]|nr:ATP-binding protein [Bacteroidota bacterium]
MEKSSPIKIGIIGAESTGKSELCEALAKHYNTVWVPEYARQYFNNSDIYNYTQEDLITIAKKQIANENELIKKANRFLFCDTTLITLKIWAELEFKQTPDFILENLGIIKYDHYFIMANEVPWMQDAQRQNKFSRNMIFDMNKAEVEKLKAPYTIINGLNEERPNNAIKIIDKLNLSS